MASTHVTVQYGYPPNPPNTTKHHQTPTPPTTIFNFVVMTNATIQILTSAVSFNLCTIKCLIWRMTSRKGRESCTFRYYVNTLTEPLYL